MGAKSWDLIPETRAEACLKERSVICRDATKDKKNNNAAIHSAGLATHNTCLSVGECVVTADKKNNNAIHSARLATRAFQFAIRIDSIRYANRFESIRFVKKWPFDSLVAMQFFLLIYCIVSAKKNKLTS